MALQIKMSEDLIDADLYPHCRQCGQWTTTGVFEFSRTQRTDPIRIVWELFCFSCAGVEYDQDNKWKEEDHNYDIRPPKSKD